MAKVILEWSLQVVFNHFHINLDISKSVVEVDLVKKVGSNEQFISQDCVGMVGEKDREHPVHLESATT